MYRFEIIFDPLIEQTKSRKRDPSFGGVADMFVDDAASDEEPSSISDVGGNQKTSNVGEFFNDTHSGPARTRVSKKLDPSFSGVADLFDDEGPDEDDDDLSPLVPYFWFSMQCAPSSL